MAPNANIRFTITYQLVDEGLRDSIDFTVGGTTDNPSPTAIILEALLPLTGGDNARYFIRLELDGNIALPTPPVAGFTDVQELYAWVQSNWPIYGRWFLTADKLILYLNAGMARRGTLSVSATARYVFRAWIPDKAPDIFYRVLFRIDGVDVLPPFPDDVAQTREDLLLWISQHWMDYGAWTIENNYLILTSNTAMNAELAISAGLPGAFDRGFSTGFDS